MSLTYCFLNIEVQTVVKAHWSRWMMVRMVGKEMDRRNAGRPSSFAEEYI